MLKTQSGKRQREKLKNARATARSQWAGPEGHVREVVEEPGHDFRMKGAVGKGSLLDTVFHVREAGFEVEKRIVESRAPLVRTTTATSSDSYYQELIPIPVKAEWNVKMKPEDVQKYEDDEFESYLQRIYDAYPPYRLNHFEHNLHVWKQLWRVVEISDILVLCADARHPLFHVPPSLYNYIVHQAKKPMICILNKIDFISSTNLNAWIEDFKIRFPLLTVVPFSSFPHEKTITNPDADSKQEKKRKAIQHEKNKVNKKDAPPPYGIENLLKVLDQVAKKKGEAEAKLREEQAAHEAQQKAIDPNWRPQRVKNKKAAFAKAREAEEQRIQEAVRNVDLMEGLKNLDLQTDVTKVVAAQQQKQEQQEREEHKQEEHEKLYSDSPATNPTDAPNVAAALADSPLDGDDGEEKDDEGEDDEEDDGLNASGIPKITVGTIGHPNVGKSSLINALFGKPVVTVSETPGKTKHLQTLALNDHIELCDCPGLVFPAVDMPRPLQVLCGIFPISQLREPYSSVQYLASRIEIEKIYALIPPTAQGILESQGIDTSGASSSSKPNPAQSKGANKQKAKKVSHAELGEDEEHQDVFAELQIQEATQKAKEYVWSAWDICEAYAKMRNYSIKGSKGLYDTQRAANDILHDALSGVILLTFSPPIRNTPLGQPSAATPTEQAASAAASSSSSN